MLMSSKPKQGENIKGKLKVTQKVPENEIKINKFARNICNYISMEIIPFIIKSSQSSI